MLIFFFNGMVRAKIVAWSVQGDSRQIEFAHAGKHFHQRTRTAELLTDATKQNENEIKTSIPSLTTASV